MMAEELFENVLYEDSHGKLLKAVSPHSRGRSSVAVAAQATEGSFYRIVSEKDVPSGTTLTPVLQDTVIELKDPLPVGGL